MPVSLLNGADLNGQRVQNAGDPTSNQDLATKKYVDSKSSSGSTSAYTDQLAAMHDVAAINMDPASASGAQGSGQNLQYAVKFWTPKTVSLSSFIIAVNNAGATLAGFYAALYDATGSLLPGSASADMSSALTATGSATIAFGAATTVPAGFFYVSWRQGTAGTQPQYRCGGNTNSAIGNLGLAGSAPGQSSPRYGLQGNAWSGSTPPATLGTIVPDYRFWVLAVR